MKNISLFVLRLLKKSDSCQRQSSEPCFVTSLFQFQIECWMFQNPQKLIWALGFLSRFFFSTGSTFQSFFNTISISHFVLQFTSYMLSFALIHIILCFQQFIFFLKVKSLIISMRLINSGFPKDVLNFWR